MSGTQKLKTTAIGGGRRRVLWEWTPDCRAREGQDGLNEKSWTMTTAGLSPLLWWRGKESRGFWVLEERRRKQKRSLLFLLPAKPPGPSLPTATHTPLLPHFCSLASPGCRRLLVWGERELYVRPASGWVHWCEACLPGW